MLYMKSNSIPLVLLTVMLMLVGVGCTSCDRSIASGVALWLLCLGGSDNPGTSFRLADSNGGSFRNVAGAKGHEIPAMAAVPQVPGAQATGASAARAANGDIPASLIIMTGVDLAQVVDVQQERVVANIPLSGYAPGVAVSTDGRYAAASIDKARGSADAVDVIDLSTMSRTGSISLPVDCYPVDLAFVPGQTEFFVACKDRDTLRRYDLLGAAGQESIEEITGCSAPNVVRFTADGERGLFSCSDSVWIYDVESATVAYEITGFESVQGIAVNTAGTRAYVGDHRDDSGFLDVVSLEPYDIIDTVKLSSSPNEVFLSPDDERVYVVGGSNLGIHDADGSILSTKRIPFYAFSGAAIRVPVE